MSCTCSTWNRFIDIGEVLTGRGASFSSCLYDPRLRRTEAHLGLTNVHRTINSCRLQMHWACMYALAFYRYNRIERTKTLPCHLFIAAKCLEVQHKISLYVLSFKERRSKAAA